MSTILINPSIENNCKFNKSETLVLNYLVRKPKVETVNPPVLIMLHGVGSNESGLFSYADQIPDKYLVISAQAPYQYSQDSYGWFKVNFVNGKPIIDNEQAEKSRIILLQFINQIVEKHSADADSVYLMGFSQGAIMAFSVALTRPDKVKAIATFSGRVLDATKKGISKSKELQDLKVLLAHSTNDAILKYNYANQSNELLKLNNIETEFITDNVGHSISENGFLIFTNWLKSK
jgi:phospholipase/carboxylesterase